MADDQNKNEHEDDITSGISSQLTGESYTTDDVTGQKGGSASGSEQITGQSYDSDDGE